MKRSQEGYTVVPYPRNRLLMVDGGRLGRQKHIVHGLLELDITDAREAIRRRRRETGAPLSFSAFFLACLGQAIEADKTLHAYRDLRRHLVIFDDVDVNMLFEVEENGERTIRPYILRGVNRKSAQEIEAEIQAFQKGHEGSEESTFIERFVMLPGFIRRACLWGMLKSPKLVKDLYGTVLVSSMGMFGTGSGWGIPVPNHTLQLTLGGVAEKPGVVRHQVEVRRYMSVTVSVDHDIVDGAPAAKFMHRLKRMVERGEGLDVR